MREKKLLIAVIALCALIIIGWIYVGVIAPYISCRRAERAIEAVKLPEDTQLVILDHPLGNETLDDDPAEEKAE